MEVKGIALTGYIPGAIGRITEMHATYYYSNWGFDLFFESKVATELSEFLNRFQARRDGFWTARAGEEIVGSVAIDGISVNNKGAHLRWFIVDPGYQGQGIGDMLMQEAMEFCESVAFHRVYLWTFSGLDRARHIYERFGFTLAEERKYNQWGKVMTEQMFELVF